MKIKLFGIFCVLVLLSSLALLFFSFRTPQRKLPVEVVDSTAIQALAELSINKFQSKPEKISTTFRAVPSDSIPKNDSLKSAQIERKSIGNLSKKLVRREVPRRVVKSKAKEGSDSLEIRDLLGMNNSPIISGDTSEILLAIAQKLFAQKDFPQAIKLFRKVLRMNSLNLRRFEMIKECIYGEAKSLREMYRIGMVERNGKDFIAAWKAVKSTFPEESPESREATIFLSKVSTILN
jgi:hypothetical protein